MIYKPLKEYVMNIHEMSTKPLFYQNLFGQTVSKQFLNKYRV